MSDASTTPTPADLARELIRRLDAHAARPGDIVAFTRLVGHRADHARTIAEALLAAEEDNADLRGNIFPQVRVIAKELVEVKTINEELRAKLAALEARVAENAALKAKECPQCGIAAADMVTDNYCAACRVEELKADNGWWAGKCEQLESALATLRSQLSRIDYAFGEPNEMGVSPYDVDLDGERVVRQVEAMVAAREWRDISNAPKDGKRIILFGTVLSYTCSRDSRGKPLGPPGVVGGYWDTDRWQSGLYEIVPTHWMPLPEPPTEDT